MKKPLLFLAARMNATSFVWLHIFADQEGLTNLRQGITPSRH